MATGILTGSSHDGELLTEVSFQVIGKGGVPEIGVMRLGFLIPNTLLEWMIWVFCNWSFVCLGFMGRSSEGRRRG
jgi:hypothetical protein